MLRVCYTVNQYAYECKLRLDDKHLDGQASSLFHHEASNATESLMHCTADVNPMCYSVQQKSHVQLLRATATFQLERTKTILVVNGVLYYK